MFWYIWHLSCYSFLLIYGYWLLVQNTGRHPPSGAADNLSHNMVAVAGEYQQQLWIRTIFQFQYFHGLKTTSATYPLLQRYSIIPVTGQCMCLYHIWRCVQSNYNWYRCCQSSCQRQYRAFDHHLWRYNLANTVIFYYHGNTRETDGSSGITLFCWLYWGPWGFM